MESQPPEVECRRRRFYLGPEPILFLYSVFTGLQGSVHQAFVTYKLCLTYVDRYGFSFESERKFCQKLIGQADGDNQTEDLLNRIQIEAAQFSMYNQVAASVPTIFAVFFIGAWSDRFGRKLPVILATANGILTNCLLIWVASVDSLPLYILFIASGVNGLCGHLIAYSGVFSMISDSVLDSKKLTLRIGLASAAAASGVLVGSLSSAAFLKYSATTVNSYAYMFALAGVFASLSFLYTVFFSRETIQMVQKKSAVAQNPTTVIVGQVQDPAGVVPDPAGVTPDSALPTPKTVDEDPLEASQRFGICRSGPLRYAHETIWTLFKRRPGRRRAYLWSQLFIFTILFSSDVGMPGLLNLYVKRAPLSFSDSEYSLLMAVVTGSMSLGMVVLPYLAKVLGFNDTLLIMFGIALSMSKSLALAFATQPWMIFLACSFGGLSAVYFTGFRAFLSKMVDRNETGRLFTAVASCEHVTPILSALAYNSIYTATVEWFAGMIYVVAAALMALLLVFASLIHIDITCNKLNDHDYEGEENSDVQRLIQ